MKSTGKGACILPHGVLFRGNVEAVIRKNLVRSGILKGIIGLPANLFYGTGIPACILVLDKENATARKGIFMIDASKGFIKDGNKNRLRERDLHQIVVVFTHAEEHPGYSRLVPHGEIEKNDFNLNLPRYIDTLAGLETHFKKWRKKAAVSLRKLQLDCLPKEVIRDLSENLLAHAEGEIQTLVVDDKWLTAIAAAVQGELDSVSQTLTGHIRLNTELVKKPRHLLEYVIIHELAHLREPTHSDRFLAILDKHHPTWREARAELNELPLAAEAWK